MSLIIFDLDGTLVRGIEGVKIPNRVDQQEFIPGVLERCAELRADGHILAIASNQGGVALGLANMDDTVARVSQAYAMIHAGSWCIATYYEKATRQTWSDKDAGVCSDPFWRKPNPGMLWHLMTMFKTFAQDTLFIGDMKSDMCAAWNAGVSFRWAADWLRDGIDGALPEGRRCDTE